MKKTTLLILMLLLVVFSKAYVFKVKAATSVTVTRQVVHIWDDAMAWYNSGSEEWFFLTSTALAAGFESASEMMKSNGMRFRNMLIPQGASITSAYLNLTAWDDRDLTVVRTRLRTELADNASRFTGLANYQGRQRSTYATSWDNIGAWTQHNEYQSPDFANQIQEVIDRDGWTSGNALVVFWDDEDNRSDNSANRERYAESYDTGTPSQAAKLTVTYTYENWVTFTSFPTNAPFSVDGDYKATPLDIDLSNGTYAVVFNSSFDAMGFTWNFAHWNDNTSLTSPSRTITVAGNASYGVTYTSEYQDINFTGIHPVFQCAMNNMFELDGMLEGNDTYRQMLLDTSPYENHGKMNPFTHPYSGATLTWGRIGKAMRFDGVDDSVIIENSASLNISEAITVGFWFMVVNGTPNQVLMCKADSSIEWVIGINNSRIYTRLVTNSSSEYSDYTSSDTIDNGVFYHFAFSYDMRDGYYTVFLHGYPRYNVTTDGGLIELADEDVFLGCYANTSNWFDGVLDEISIYPYKLPDGYIATLATDSIERFETFEFISSGYSTGEPPQDLEESDWTTQEGLFNTSIVGFHNNDKELPFVNYTYCASTNNTFTVVRALRYIAGFQQYQLYCTIKAESNTSQTYGYGTGNSTVVWHWNFFKDGLLQVTYRVEVAPFDSNVSDGDCDDWQIRMSRETPYSAEVNMSVARFNTNTTLFANTLPIIVSAWVGGDSTSFTVRVDAWDSRLITSGDSLPLHYTYDLVDSNLNVRRATWFDGWVVQGLMVRYYDDGLLAVNDWAYLSVETHAIAFIHPVVAIITVLGVIGIAVMVVGEDTARQVLGFVKEKATQLQWVKDMIGTVVQYVGDTVADAIAGLSHDFIGSILGLGTVISNGFQHLERMFAETGKFIVMAYTLYMQELVNAFYNAVGVWFEGTMNSLDTTMAWLFAALGAEGGWTVYQWVFGQVYAYFSSLASWAGSIAVYTLVLFNDNMSKFLTLFNITLGTMGQFLYHTWSFLDGTLTGGFHVWNELNMTAWVQIGVMMYPLYLMFLWEKEGLGAVFDQLRFILDCFLIISRVVFRLLIIIKDTVAQIIEMIPLAE